MEAGGGPVGKSVLSAEAKEWFPASYVDEAHSRLVRMLEEVTCSPGRFASLASALVESYATTPDRARLVDAVVAQAVQEPNFRYNAARLCTMFDAVHANGDDLFRRLLLERCLAEAERSPSAGAALFLAELYTQLELPEGGRVPALARALTDLLLVTLRRPEPEAVKAACNVLKLAGLALDADRKPAVDDVFAALRKAEACGVHAPLVRNLLNLRRSRWGSQPVDMADCDAPPPPQPQPPRHHRQPPAQLYLPEGHALTDEEAAFLERHLPEEPSVRDRDDDMSDEQRNDFLDFLRAEDHARR